MESALIPAIDMATSPGHRQGIAAADFNQIVFRHQRRIFTVLYSLIGDRDLADNLTQDCFLRAYARRSTFRGESSIETWLIRIAVNLARDHARNRRLAFWRNILQHGSQAGEEAPAIEALDPCPSAERALIAREQLAAVKCLLEKISPQQRTAFSLRFFEEMSLEEIADVMELEIGTVKAHLSRAVNAVRNRLKEQRAK